MNVTDRCKQQDAGPDLNDFLLIEEKSEDATFDASFNNFFPPESLLAIPHLMLQMFNPFATYNILKL